MKKDKLAINDVLGGLTGAAVALPQSIGLGVVLFTAMGLDASAGALAGLLGAIILQFVVGGVSATTGVISAPNGPMTMLLVGVMTAMSQNGMSSDTMVLTLSAILVLTGVFQIIFSLLGGTKLIKFIPYPVIAGLIAGVGILMVDSQWNLLIKEWSSSVPPNIEESFGFIIAAITILFMVLIPKVTKGKVPAAIAGLIAGISSYFVLIKLLSLNPHASWVVGPIPSISSLSFNFHLDKISNLPLSIVLSSAFALTILGTVDSLVTSLLADSKTGERHNSKKEIITQGSSEILIGLVGGLGGWGTKGATLVATGAGGRRWSPIVAGALFLIIFLYAGHVGDYLPLSVLAGIISMVGIGMIDINIFKWLKYKEMRIDGIVAVLVVIATITFSLIVAVGVGISLAILLFLYQNANQVIIHRRSTGVQRRSSCAYSVEAEYILKKYGNNTVLYELKGDIFFGTADRLRSVIENDIQKNATIILHFRRVDQIDMSGMIVLLQITDEARNKNCEIVFCYLHKGLRFGKKIKDAFAKIDSKRSFDSKVFEDTDSTLEYAEKKLLKFHGMEVVKEQEISFEKNSLCRTLKDSQIMRLKELSTLVKVEKNSYVFKQDDFDECIYLIYKGEVELRLNIADEGYKRISKYESGSYFGELLFIHPGNRESDAIATEYTELYVVKRSSLKELKKGHIVSLVLALTHEFSHSMRKALRYSANEIRRLEEW
jgi:SulP family sulfate permease